MKDREVYSETKRKQIIFLLVLYRLKQVVSFPIKIRRTCGLVLI
jgi:hypothetical protein